MCGFFLLCFNIGSSQQKKVEISGIIVDARTSLPVVYSFVELQLGDTIIRQQADTGGKFKISFSQALFKGNPANLFIWQNRGAVLDERQKKISCKEAINFGGYLSENIQIPYTDSMLSNYFYEVTLIPVETEFVFPLIIFKKNSLKVLKTENVLTDTSFICLMEGLTINPGLKLEIAGYGFEENDENKISLARAEYIKNKLVKLGANPDRLVVKGYGANEPKWSKEDILVVGDEAKRRQMIIMNRRVEFKIIAFDFNRKNGN